MGVIFDLDQTIIDSSIAERERKKRKWNEVYRLIPYMKPYTEVVDLIKELVRIGVEVAVVTSSPREYCKQILSYLGITNVITVCYYDTKKHKPEPEPLQLAIDQMKDQNGKIIVAIGDKFEDTIAANKLNLISILGRWGNKNIADTEIRPCIFCRDEESLLRIFKAWGANTKIVGLRQRKERIYQLFDYYPQSRTHDSLSKQIFNEVKCKNGEYAICNIFLKTLIETIETLGIEPNTYGVFIVPSSTEGKWNDKLMNIVVPNLISCIGLIDCSNYILRHTTHDKQAFGGVRSLESNLATIRLQYQLPSNMKGAIIIDDITTTGKIFDACRWLLCQEGIVRKNIYCAAIAGTEHID